MKNKQLGFICGMLFTVICLVAVLAPIGLVTAHGQINDLQAENLILEQQILDQAETIRGQHELINAYKEQITATAGVLEQASETLEQLAYGPYTREEIQHKIAEVAEVVREVNKALSSDQVQDISYHLVINAVAAGVDPLLLLSMAITESHCRPVVRGAAGEYGMLQVMPGTGRWIAGRLGYAEYHPEQMLDIKTNIQFAAYYLRVVTREFGCTMKGVLAYNAGSRGARDWMAANSVNEHRYVRRVMSTYESLRGI